MDARETLSETLHNMPAIPQKRLRAVEELCYTATESGLLDFKLFGNELECVMKMIQLADSLDSEIPPELIM